MKLFKFFNNKKLTDTSNEHKEATVGNLNGVGDTPLDAEYTPEKITSLGRKDIFVFGSNLAGHHGGGAARVAYNRFGAIWGQGEGLQGNSYAIPTMQGGIETIRPYVERFIEFAAYEKELTFYVTKIGCGIAGFTIAEIAPLFRKALLLPNIRLPKEFADINFRQGSEDAVRKDMMVHTHGITRTFADLVIARNEKAGFVSPSEVLDYLSQYFDRFHQSGDDVAFIAVRTFWSIIQKQELFKDKKLDVVRFRECMTDPKSYSNDCDKAYELYCKEKIYNLVVFLNEFRRYRTPEEVLADIEASELTKFSHCGPNSYNYDMSPIGAGNQYPIRYFDLFITENWDNITSNGVLDGDKLDELMFKKHERGLRKYGINAVINHDYETGGSCLSDVYFPHAWGTGPVYIKQATGDYAISCSHGTNPISIPNYLECMITLKLIQDDVRYKQIGEFFVPKFDITLPILGYYTGKMNFSDLSEKQRFIDNLRRRAQGC